MKPVYLDYSAGTPLDPRVLTAMTPFFSENFYNPSALYLGARQAKTALETARASVSSIIGARPSEIIFTAGGTESANLAVKGVMEKYPDSELIISAVEHDAVLKPAGMYDYKLAPVSDKGLVDLKVLEKLITDKTVLVSVMYANNEVGTVQPIREISQIVSDARKDRKVRHIDTPLYLHTDACQAPQYLEINIARLGVDLMTLNGGKIYGPKQSGILYARAGVLLKPQILGGGQENGYRSGTENISGSVGFAKALELIMRNKQDSSRKTAELAKYFASDLEVRFGAIINGHQKLRLPNNVHVTFKGADNERMLFSLDVQGIYASVGSACSASSDEPSHVLKAMGISDEYARSSLRFSLGRETTRDEIDRTLSAIEVAIKA
jgi:cysteine desulfurase